MITAQSAGLLLSRIQKVKFSVSRDKLLSRKSVMNHEHFNDIPVTFSPASCGLNHIPDFPQSLSIFALSHMQYSNHATAKSVTSHAAESKHLRAKELSMNLQFRRIMLRLLPDLFCDAFTFGVSADYTSKGFDSSDSISAVKALLQE